MIQHVYRHLVTRPMLTLTTPPSPGLAEVNGLPGVRIVVSSCRVGDGRQSTVTPVDVEGNAVRGRRWPTSTPINRQ